MKALSHIDDDDDDDKKGQSVDGVESPDENKEMVVSAEELSPIKSGRGCLANGRRRPIFCFFWYR